MRALLGLSVAATLLSCGGEARKSPEDVVAEIDRIASELVSSGEVAGLSVAVVKRGQERLVSGWGVADRESGAPATAATPYRILSISKQVTAVALLRLVEEGRVSLDDRLGSFFPSLGAAAAEIQLRHLLSHTSGLPELWEMPGWDEAETTADLAALYDGRPLLSPPGSLFVYRDVNYVFAGLVVEQITGEALSAHLARTLFEPLGMDATSFCDGLATRGYLGDLVAAPELHVAADEGSTAMCSTVRDLATWQRAFDEHELLGDELTTLARTPTRTAGGATVRYGMGVDLSLGGTRDTVGHGGSGAGWIATLVHDVDADLTVIILSNTSSPAVNTARAEITAAALALP